MIAVTTELIEQFKTEAGRAGFVVYEASGVEDANNYMLKLAQERDVKHAVKSKSRMADKLGLRQRLEKAGIEVKETDLKDWIAQLAGGNPTGRQSIEQVAKLISKATAKKLKPDPKVLLSAANRILRQSCIDADMGISEADVAIAETGTLVIIGNEGSTRLVAVLPRIHVTIVDYDNIVPTFEYTASRLKSPSKKSVNQRISSYVTYITGRNTTADIPGAILARAQGPAEEHMLLVNKSATKRGAA
jgi:L-lactate utilization protein LutB